MARVSGLIMVVALPVIQVNTRTPILGNCEASIIRGIPGTTKVRVHAKLVKRGQAGARCSVEEVQPFRILEIIGCLRGQAGQVVNVDLFPHPLGKLLNQKIVFGHTF